METAFRDKCKSVLIWSKFGLILRSFALALLATGANQAQGSSTSSNTHTADALSEFPLKLHL